MALKKYQQIQFTTLRGEALKNLQDVQGRIENFYHYSEPLFGIKTGKAVIKTTCLTPDELESFKTALTKYEKMRNDYRESLSMLITATATKSVTQAEYLILDKIPAYDYGMIEPEELKVVNKVLLFNNHSQIEIIREPIAIVGRRISMQINTVKN